MIDKTVVSCVDDDPDMLAWMATVLSGLGAEIRTYRDSRRALEELRRSPPSLILLDIAMPEMDGYSLCAALRKDARCARVPAIFLTGLAGKWERSRAFLAGAVDYLTKPIREDALLRAVRAHLETSRVFEEVMRLVDRPASAPRPTSRWEELYGPASFARFKAYLAENRKLPVRAFDWLRAEDLFSGAAGLGLRERTVTAAMSQFFPAPYLSQIRPADVRTGILPTAFCFERHVLPVGDPLEPPTFVAANPFDPRVVDAVRSASRGRTPWISLAEPSSFDVLRDWSFATARRKSS
jgi:CheY-like chemotaxis protein